MVSWEAARAGTLAKLERDLKDNLVDEELIQLLKALNEHEDMFTTSSCAGRITVGCNDVALEDKRGTEHLLVSHGPVSVYDVMKVLENKKCTWMWIKASQPLLDISVKKIDLAMKIVTIARSAGFKYSGVQPYGGQYFRVLIRGSDNVQYPLSGKEDEKVLAKVISHANAFLLNGKLKLARFVSALENENLISLEEELLFDAEEL